MNTLKPLSQNKKQINPLENIQRIKKEVEKWPKWKVENTKLAFSENLRKIIKKGSN